MHFFFFLIVMRSLIGAGRTADSLTSTVAAEVAADVAAEIAAEVTAKDAIEVPAESFQTLNPGSMVLFSS